MTPRFRRARDAGARGLLWLSAMLSAALMLFLIGYICFRGLPGISWAFLAGQESVLRGTVGILPSILNTLYVVVASLAMVLPVGVGAAVYLTEYARNRWLVGLVEFAAEALAGIPSILYALAGGIVFCERLGLGRTLLAGAFTLAVMTLPTILRTTQESLKTVPAAYREGALGLGSGKWRMIRTVVLPSSMDGIAAGCVLTVGRVVGESAVLLY
ncbi:MAG: phosphate ABC transporter permease PstA, partial [Oscillospiraceae bacterium]|nr:phosphate ABC transporter permease PstA [Oscillospiraceae bacterium]